MILAVTKELERRLKIIVDTMKINSMSTILPLATFSVSEIRIHRSDNLSSYKFILKSQDSGLSTKTEQSLKQNSKEICLAGRLSMGLSLNNPVEFQRMIF